MRQILLADDDDLIRDLYRMLISENFPNYRLEIFPHGKALVERLERDVSDVALVLTDNSMPGFTGSEIIRKYARDIRFGKIPFILSYAGNEEIGKKAMGDGAFALIRKPSNLVDFVNILQTACDRYK